MFDDLIRYACGDLEAEKRVRSLRHSVTFRAVNTSTNTYDLRGPAIIGQGRFAGRDMVRRWMLGGESHWYTVVVDGLGNSVEWQLWNGHGEAVFCPLELAISCTRALTEIACRHRLRGFCEEYASACARELEYLRVSEDGRLTDE